jgi:hypothetical protein
MGRERAGAALLGELLYASLARREAVVRDRRTCIGAQHREGRGQPGLSRPVVGGRSQGGFARIETDRYQASSPGRIPATGAATPGTAGTVVEVTSLVANVYREATSHRAAEDEGASASSRSRLADEDRWYEIRLPSGEIDGAEGRRPHLEGRRQRPGGARRPTPPPAGSLGTPYLWGMTPSRLVPASRPSCTGHGRILPRDAHLQFADPFSAAVDRASSSLPISSSSAARRRRSPVGLRGRRASSWRPAAETLVSGKTARRPALGEIYQGAPSAVTVAFLALIRSRLRSAYLAATVAS